MGFEDQYDPAQTPPDKESYEAYEQTLIPPEPKKQPTSPLLGTDVSMMYDGYAKFLIYCRMVAEFKQMIVDLEAHRQAVDLYWEDEIQWLLPEDHTSARDNLFNSEGQKLRSPGSDCVVNKDT